MSESNPKISRRYAVMSAVAAAAAMLLLLVIWDGSHPGSRSMPSLPDDNVAARKEAFFDFLRPVVDHHNDRIAQERAWLLALDPQEPPGWFARRRFEKLADNYGVDTDELDYPEALALLLRRVDMIPQSLVLVQAAKESGWGRSRFAREGNALFGEWCFKEGCGMVPGSRGAGRTHEVRSFDTVHDAVGSYMNNLNSHRSYRGLRIARESMREREEELSGTKLAEGLSKYSERGEAYVREVQSMIRQNGLESG